MYLLSWKEKSKTKKPDLITKNQSGFRPGDSTMNQLLFLVNEIQEAINAQVLLVINQCTSFTHNQPMHKFYS